MRVLFWGGLLLALACGFAGMKTWRYSQQWGYYTDSFFQKGSECAKSEARDHLINALADKESLSRDQHTWFTELRRLETPRKRYADLGIGLIGLGMAWLGLVAGSMAYRRYSWTGRRRIFWSAWIIAWLIQIPGDLFYYTYHELRGDYPPWADSIIIPVFSAAVSALIGGGLTFLLLRHWMKGRAWPDRIRFVLPGGSAEWVRFVLLALWVGWMWFSAYSEIFIGGAAAVMAQFWAGCLLCVVLSAEKPSEPQAP